MLCVGDHKIRPPMTNLCYDLRLYTDADGLSAAPTAKTYFVIMSILKYGHLLRRYDRVGKAVCAETPMREYNFIHLSL